MKTALRGISGTENSLDKYINREQGEKNSKKWEMQPHCKKCGVIAHVHETSTGIVSHFLAEEATPGQVTDNSGFYHAKPSLDCPEFFKKDPTYKDIAHHSFDVRTRMRNFETIHDAKNGNARVLNLLMFHLTGSELTQEKKRNLYDVTEKKLLNMEILGEHPWLLPYLLVSLAGHYERKHPTKKRTINVEAVAFGKREVSYTSYTGETRRERIPTELRFVQILAEHKKIITEPLRHSDGEPIVYQMTFKKYVQLVRNAPTLPQEPQPAHSLGPAQLGFKF